MSKSYIGGGGDNGMNVVLVKKDATTYELPHVRQFSKCGYFDWGPKKKTVGLDELAIAILYDYFGDHFAVGGTVSRDYQTFHCHRAFSKECISCLVSERFEILEEDIDEWLALKGLVR